MEKFLTIKLFREAKVGIFPSPKFSIEGAKSRAYIGRGSENLFRDGKLEIILSPNASIRKSLEFFKVSKPISRGRARNFFVPKSL